MSSKLWNGTLADGRTLVMRELTVDAMDEVAMSAAEAYPNNMQQVQQEATRLSFLASIMQVGDLSRAAGNTPEEMHSALGRMRGQMQLMWSRMHNTTDEEDADFLASIGRGDAGTAVAPVTGDLSAATG